MNTQEIIGFAITGIGVAFGFGRQAANISNNQKDIHAIAKLHRETQEQLHDIKIIVAKLEQKIDMFIKP